MQSRWIIAVAVLLSIGHTSSGQALAGKRIVVSPGHGYYWHTSLGWITQRPTIDGLTEDFHTNEIMMDYVTPLLEGAGAMVIPCRARSRTTYEVIGDNDFAAPSYAESGGWSTSASSGWSGGSYRFTNTSLAGGQLATYTLPISVTDRYPVYVWYRDGANRTTEARFEIDHAAGTSVREIDQTIDGSRWYYVGTFPFRAGENAVLRWSSQSGSPGVIVADAVKIGDGTGSIIRGGSTSGQPRWRECSRYHAEYFGAPSTVWNPLSTGQDNGDDVTCRPFYGEWWGADLFLSLHTNAGGGQGTSTWTHDTSPTPGSTAFQNILHNRIINDLQSSWSANWVNDGQHTANFGEVRELSTMPGVLVELAYHDDIGGDLEALHHPRFRRIAGRALYRGVVEYLNPGAAFTLEPPVRVAAVQTGFGGLTIKWASVLGATSYRVYLSDDGFAFDEGQIVNGTTLLLTGLPHGALKFAKVAPINSGGEGFASEVVGARVSPGGAAPLLLVNGFDRLDRFVKEADNKKDGIVTDGAAIDGVIAAGYPFDGCTNEAVQGSLVTLNAYRTVGWILGEESTVDQTFDLVEQLTITAYLQSGGRFFFSGAEVGWDLDWLGSASDRNFYENTLGQDYVADDAGTYTLQAVTTGPLSPLPQMVFDNGLAGIYNVDYPDVVAPPPSSLGQIVWRYSTGQGAAVLSANGRVLGIGFPLEAIVSPADRALVWERILDLMCPLPVSSPAPLAQGATSTINIDFAGASGQVFITLASFGPYPGTPLGDGRAVPVNIDALLTFMTGAQPYFTQTVGMLDSFGHGQSYVTLPATPSLSGISFVMTAVTLNTVGGVDDIAPWVNFVIP